MVIEGLVTPKDFKSGFGRKAIKIVENSDLINTINIISRLQAKI
jgi:hypothetical protein